MAVGLVTLAEQQQFLGIKDDKHQDLLQSLIASTVRLFEGACNRRHAPFNAEAQANLTEVHDSTGSTLLALHYPIASVASVKLGFNVNAPDETLTLPDVAKAVFTVGQRILRRVDGGMFGLYGKPGYVHASYTTEIDAPEDAKLAVMRVVAQVYRQRGSEDAASYSVAGYSQQMADLAARDSTWLLAVQNNRFVWGV